MSMPPAAVNRRRQVILSWSGGKDSSLTLHALETELADRFEVVALLTSLVVDEGDADDGPTARISSHHVRRRLLDDQLAAFKRPLPVFPVRLPSRPANGEYERAFFSALTEALAAFPQAECVAFGDLFLADIKAYRERMLLSWEGNRSATPGQEGDGTPRLQPLFPLWDAATGPLACRFIDLGFKARLVCVDTTQLDARFAGRAFDASLLADLPEQVDPCGEKGEFHTYVWDGPLFRRPVALRVGAVTRPGDGRFAYCDLLPAGAEEQVDDDEEGEEAAATAAAAAASS